MMNAILKVLTPNEISPPSPKKSACINSATLKERQAAKGPTNTAIKVAPTACPVVPPGIGILNIISKNENAAKTPMTGIFFVERSFLIFLVAQAQTGIIEVPITAQVDGLR